MSLSRSAPSTSHLPAAVRGLVQTGWGIVGAPVGGRLPRNGQLVILKTPSRDTRIRLFIYKVTGSSRGRPNERRIEITSTYQNGLIDRLSNFKDIVLGSAPEQNLFVGVDARRIEEGGPTGNASSFFDEEGLSWTRNNEIHVRQRTAKLFENGIEFHAFFKPQCLGEYLLNVEAIHDGSYAPIKVIGKRGRKNESLTVPDAAAIGDTLVLAGSVATRSVISRSNKVIDAFERGDTANLRRSKISQEALLEIKRRCDENGRLGEEFVLTMERRRLRRLGEENLAKKVKWISVESACEGYDILSYETDGTERFIEVKSTVGKRYVFEMSDNEWNVAKNREERYFIYRVTDVRNKPKCKMFPN